MNFDALNEHVLVRIKDYDKSRTYSGLTLLLNGLASGYGWQSYPKKAPASIEVYFSEHIAATLTQAETDRICTALREVSAWQPPSTAGMPLRYHRSEEGKARANKKAWVERARQFLEDAFAA